MSLKNRLVFLKLGGSLITDKNQARTPRRELLGQLAQAIQSARKMHPDIQLLIGHGSGSFGHVAANKYGTRQGVKTPAEWKGFAQVWLDASSLNRLVIAALSTAGIPAVSFPLSAAALAQDGRLLAWETTPIQRALMAELVPVVYGDVAFDIQRGGTIISTEEIFEYLAALLKPSRILLAGIEPGVWQDYPKNTQLITAITPASLPEVQKSLGGSASIDVTGGMVSKVHQALKLVQNVPDLDVFIFSGLEPGAVIEAFGDHPPGTRLYIDSQTDLD
jgi:isopentenyl phosphate kinase